MSSDQEEIMSELAEEGVTPDTMAETEAAAGGSEAVSEAAPEEAAGGEVAGEADEVGEGVAPAPEPAAVPPPAPVDQRDAAIAELRAEIARQRADVARLEQASFQRTPVVDADAQVLAQDPSSFRTAAELVAYNQAWLRREQRMAELRAEMRGRIAASEQHARGLLSTATVGEGFDYDTIVARHVAEAEAQDPVFAQFLQSRSDPAMTRFTLGLVQEVQRMAGGDPVRAVKLIRSALGGEQRGAKAAIAKAAEAVRRGATRVRSGAGAGVAGTKKFKDAKDIWDASDAEFDKLERNGLN